MKSILEYNNSIDQGEDEGGLTGALSLLDRGHSTQRVQGTHMYIHILHAVCTHTMGNDLRILHSVLRM